DFKDQKALHLLGKKDGRLVAYTRVFNANDYFDKASIGRVLVRDLYREHGYGHKILKASIEAIYSYLTVQPIILSEHQHLENIYNRAVNTTNYRYTSRDI